MVRVASPLTLLMLPSRHSGPATDGQYKEILVTHSGFLMRLLSHNPLSTPWPPTLGGLERRTEGHPQTPGRRFSCTSLCANPLSPPLPKGDSRELLGLGNTPKPPAKGHRPLCTPYLSRRGTACCPLHPPGQSPLHRRERIRVRVTVTVTDTPGLQPGGLLALFCHSRGSP
jgi:hypothetical protein